MATSYVVPTGQRAPSPPSFSQPTSAAAMQVPDLFSHAPPAPLPQTLFGTTQQTSFST